jgi:hypothetical protein
VSNVVVAESDDTLVKGVLVMETTTNTVVHLIASPVKIDYARTGTKTHQHSPTGCKAQIFI